MKNLAITFAILTLIIVIGAFFIPLNAGVVAVASGLWIFIVASILVFSLSILLIFILSGIGLLIFSILPILWGVVAIVLFPFLLPLIAPLLLIFGFIYILRKKQVEKMPDDK